MNDQDVTIVIRANPAQFAAAMKAVQDGMKNTSNAVKNGGNVVTNFASNAADAFGSISDGIWNVVKTAGLLGTTGAFGIVAMAKASWDQVSAVQQASVALRAYEKDGALVNKVLNELVTYARSDMGVLFQRQDLFAAAQGLKMMGAETTNLTRYVEVMSRSVGLGLANWEDLTRIIGRVGSTGKLTGNDFEYLQSAGFKLDKSLRNTNITYDKLFAALDKGIPANAMAGQANTIRGTFVRLQSAFRDLGADILGVDKATSTFAKGGLGDILTGSLSELIQFLKTPEMKQGFVSMGKGMAEFAKSAIPVIKNVLLWVVTNGDTVIAIIKGLAAALIVSKAAFIAFSIAANATPFGLIATAITILIGVFVALQSRFDIIGKAVNAVSGAFKWMRDVFNEVKDTVSAFSSATMERFSEIIDSVTDALITAKNAVVSLITDALGWLGDRLNDITSWIKDHQVALRDWAIVIGTLLLPKMTQLGIEAAKAAWSAMVAWAKSFGAMTASAAKTTWSMTVESIKASVAWVRSAAVSSYAWVTKELPKIITAMYLTSKQSAIAAIQTSAAWIKQAWLTSLAWGKTFALYLAQVAVAVWQTGVAAVRMAASWLLAMGPIGLIIAAVIGIAALIINHWDTVKQWMSTFWNWFQGIISSAIDWVKDNWPLLIAILAGPLGMAAFWIYKHLDSVKAAFASALEYVKGIWGGISGFFAGVWGSIVGIFSRIGVSIGDAFSGAIRGAVNSVLGFAERTINGFISNINNALGTINKIPGVNIGKIGALSVPRLATGGIVNATPGGQLVTVAEGGQAEWIVPESKMASVVSQLTGRANNTMPAAPTQNITQEFNINITIENDGTEFTRAQAESMARKIAESLRAQGLGINEMGALRA